VTVARSTGRALMTKIGRSRRWRDGAAVFRTAGIHISKDDLSASTTFRIVSGFARP